MRGYTLIELIIVLGIFAVLTGIATVNLLGFQRQTNITGVVDTFITNVKEQQTKAMSGDTEGRGENSSYGVNIALTNYVLFHGTFTSGEQSNRIITLPAIAEITTTFPNAQLIFEGGSGELAGYASANATVTIRDTVSNDQKTIYFNRYGVVTAIN